MIDMCWYKFDIWKHIEIFFVIWIYM